ncbi:MAG: 1-phosphofructokinase family hexose kinase [Sphingobacteriaceae bacterium]|nr:MAG: 1-phosphofructokinase family hexose kinase [Sphingobacteriaceae bacterium]
MPQIVTITFNPALDESTSVAELVADKKLKCSQPVCEPGGGGINVARAITKLGGEALAMYLAGGDTGKKIRQLLDEDLVRSVVIETAESTRVNLVVADIANKKQYLLDMPGGKVNDNEWQACLNAIAQLQDVKYLVASGSLPPGVPTDIFARIASIAKSKGALLIVDTAGEALQKAVGAGVYLIKPNLRELATIAGKIQLDIASVPNAAREVINSGNCEVVVVSMGPDGAYLITKDISVKITPPALTVKSTVGAGDSMVAGIVLSLASNKGLLEAVQYGVACGSAATVNYGTQLCSKTDADLIYNSISVKS